MIYRWPNDFVNKIICADCLDAMKDIPDKSVDLIIADPPYLVTSQDWDSSEVFCKDHINEFKRVIKDTGNLYVWCGIGEKSQSLIRWFPLISEKFYFKDLITWKKQLGFGSRRGWLYTREEIMWFVSNKKKYFWNLNNQYSDERRKRDSGKDVIKVSQNRHFAKSLYKRLTNIWTDIHDDMNFSKRPKHYTPKPVRALERIILAHTIEGDVVLDPFVGSGSTALACVKTKRNFIGIDISEEYCKIALDRIKI